MNPVYQLLPKYPALCPELLCIIFLTVGSRYASLHVPVNAVDKMGKFTQSTTNFATASVKGVDRIDGWVKQIFVSLTLTNRYSKASPGMVGSSY